MIPVFLQTQARGIRLLSLLLLLLTSARLTFGQTEVIVDFEKAEITGRWIESWEEKGVVFTPAHAPTRSKAKARLMFFPHIPSGRKGILSALADDPIPVRARFPTGAMSVMVVFWGSTGCAARLEAYDQDGKLVDKAALEVVPGRKAPGDPIPTFELTVKASHIAYVEFSGPRTGEYLAANEVRFVPIAAAPKEESKRSLSVGNCSGWLPQQFDASILSDEATAPGQPNFTGAFLGMAGQDMSGPPGGFQLF